MGALYASFMDVEAVERRGLDPIRDELAAIDAAGTPAPSSRRCSAPSSARAVGGALGLFVDNDAKDPERYVVHTYQDGLGLPDEAYYREEQYAAVLEAYRAHVAQDAGPDRARRGRGGRGLLRPCSTSRPGWPRTTGTWSRTATRS